MPLWIGGVRCTHGHNHLGAEGPIYVLPGTRACAVAGELYILLLLGFIATNSMY